MSSTDLQSSMRPIKVALWSTPRSMSTVMTRCMSGIDGIEVYSALFSYVNNFRQNFATATGRELPLTLEGNEAVYEEAHVLWEKNLGGRLHVNRLSFQDIKRELEDASGSKYVLFKDLSIVMDGYRDFIPRGFRHTFLIRKPSQSFVSWKKSSAVSFHKILPCSSEYDIIRDDPLNFQPLTWFERQHNLWRYLKETSNEPPIIIAASDLAANPQSTLQAYCEAVGFPYSDSLIEWEPISELPKNFHMSGPNLFKDLFKFYNKAFTSTKFETPGKEALARELSDQLTEDIIQCIESSMPFYEEMYRERLCVL